MFQIPRYLNIHCSSYEGNTHQDTDLLSETSKTSPSGLSIKIVFCKLWRLTYPKYITISTMAVWGCLYTKEEKNYLLTISSRVKHQWYAMLCSQSELYIFSKI